MLTLHRYDAALALRADWAARSPHLHSNAGICAVRRAHDHATALWGWNHGHAPGDATAAGLHARAAAAFATAAGLLRKDRDGGGEDDVAATVRGNLAKFEAWKAHGGAFQGALMW